MIKAVVFDLDDTLYPEIEYVNSGFRAVSSYVESEYGITCVETELNELFSVSHTDVFGRFMSNHNLPDSEQKTAKLVAIYRYHTPDITLRDGAVPLLNTLRSEGYKLGIITDGEPQRQRLKITALGLEKMVDNIIVTDELGGSAFEKPCPVAFELMCKAFGILPHELLYVGDNPKKDFAIKGSLPVKTAELSTAEGIYRHCEYLNGIEPDYKIMNVNEILQIVHDEICI